MLCPKTLKAPNSQIHRRSKAAYVVIAINNTTASIIAHQMYSRAEYTTNDVNLMSDAAIAKCYTSEQGQVMGADYLGGLLAPQRCWP